jgi:4'-phosphopantetheinyl transferase
MNNETRIIAMIDTKTHLSVNENQVHLWRFNLESVPEDWQAEGRHYLSDDENERAAKFKRGGDDYINTRIFMRNTLATYLNRSPEKLIFDRNPYGKPFLRGEDLAFNLSHSRQWAVLAVGINCDLGIDVESTSDRRSILDIAKHYFHEDEIATLTEMTDPDQQKDYFFRLWTLKESFLKALGTGISTGLDKVNFKINSETTISADFSSELKLNNPKSWQFFQFELQDASVKNWCAVAVKSQNKILLSWR